MRRLGVEKDFYNHFRGIVHQYSEDIDMDSAMHSQDNGLVRVKDRFVHFKAYLNEAQSYIGVVTMVFTLLALVPIAFEHINEVFGMVGSGFSFPILYTSFFVGILYVVFILFGYLSYCKAGLVKRNMEISGLISPSTYMILDYCMSIEEELNEVKKLVWELKR